MGSLKSLLACALAFVVSISLLSAPVSALDRSEGDYWVYQGSMDYIGVSVSGGYRYEFEEKASLVVGQETYDVNVLKVTGSMTGDTDESALVPVHVELVFSGYSYEVDGSLATVKEDMYTWANTTSGTGSLSIVTRIETRDVMTYLPPTPAGFVDGETGTGDEWVETTNISRTFTTWVDDTDFTVSADYEEVYSYSVAAAEEEVETEAGTFSCLKMTVADSHGAYEIYWYSSDVGCWVKISSFAVGESTPYLTLELTEYQYSGDSLVTILIIVGVGVLVVVAVVAMFLLMRRRGGAPSQPQQPTPPPPPTG